MQPYGGIYLLSNYFTCFGCHCTHHQEYEKTIIAASGTGHGIRVTTFRQRGLRPRWWKVVAQIL